MTFATVRPPNSQISPTSRPRLSGGRIPLWRSQHCVQLGLDPRCALVVDGLSPTLADLVRGLDGRHTFGELVDATGADEDEAAGLLAELAAAGAVEDAGNADQIPPVLAADIASWTLRCGLDASELLAGRAGATVEVHGNGRVAVAVAALLASSGIGCVHAHCGGRVAAEDVGIGYRERDIGQHRRSAATAAIRRHRAPGVRPHAGTLPDLVVVADAAVHDPVLAVRLVAERVPHLAVQAREGRVIVGPLVLPGRTGCLRCVALHRSERDPCWPRLAAQLVDRPVTAELTGAAVAAGMATEQVLALLAGSSEPPSAGATLELDPLQGRPVRRRWPAHPRCGCGAARAG